MNVMTVMYPPEVANTAMLFSHTAWPPQGESGRRPKYGVSSTCSKLRSMLIPMAIPKGPTTAIFHPNTWASTLQTWGAADACDLHTAAFLEPDS